VVGAILVLLGLSAISVLPINWLGAALLLVAFTLFALEAKFAAHGVLAVGGTVSMVLGAVMLIDSPLPGECASIGARPSPWRCRFPSSPWAGVAGRARAAQQGGDRREGMIGETGSAVTDLAPEGKVFVHGEYWNAVALQNVPAGRAGARHRDPAT
jgi:membrane-bound serine protease (ClpP class)